MTVRTRLVLTFAAIVLLLAVPTVYGLIQLNRLRGIAVELEGRHASASLALGRLQRGLADFDRFQRGFLGRADTAARAAMFEGLNRMAPLVDRLDRAGYGDPARRIAVQIDSLAATTLRMDSLMTEGMDAEAVATFETQIEPRLAAIRSSFEAIAAAIDERSAARAHEAGQVSLSAQRTVAVAVAAGLLLTLVVGAWTTRAISGPLERLSEATAVVAAGEFSAPPDLPYERDDEIGGLSRSFGSMAERLAELDRLKAEFVSLASHELKTPINVIAGYTELLEEGMYGETDQRQREVLGLIQEQTTALARLVNQLLDLSRLEAGGFRLEPRPVNPEALLQRVARSFEALARQKEIRLEVTAEGLPERVTVDPDRIQHEVLSNLLSNAFKFTPRGGRIRLSARALDDRLLLTVADTGVGIPDDELPHIFEKYYQVGREARVRGSGLGLAIVRQIVRAHGGEVRAESRVGEGTTFRITVPLHGTAHA